MSVRDKLQYYATEQLGPKRRLTAEGFLLCEDVPIARVGMQLYGEGEVPVPADAEGHVQVDRHPEDVFRPETVASFNGKPVVNGHPAEDVAPHNWRELAVGTVQNPRRAGDYILAELLIYTKEEIEAVNGGLREVSCGYDADYVQLADEQGNPIPGRAKQVNIMGNHVALVEAGRCGPRCAIGDSTLKEKHMTLKERLLAAFKSKDETALSAALAEIPSEGGATHVHVHTADAKAKDCDCGKADCKECGAKTKDGLTKDAVVDAVFADKRFTDVADNVKRIADAFEKKDDDDDDDDKTDDEMGAANASNRAIEGSLEMEAPPGTSDGVAAKAKDSAYLVDAFQESISMAEIIAPGINIPTFDAKADPKKTYDSLCKFRKNVLDTADRDPNTHVFIQKVTGDRGYAKYTCDGVRTVFNAVAAFKRKANNDAITVDTPLMSGGGTGSVDSKLRTPADINRRNAELYKTV